jgi:hypothetical protein
MNEQEYCAYLISLHLEKVGVMEDAIGCAMITVATLLNELQILNFADKQITFWKKVYKLLDYEFRAYTENS